MLDYTSIDTSTLTVDDALNDRTFNKTPRDYYEYTCFDASIMENVIFDFTIDEAGEALMAIADFCVNGTEPDYSVFSTTAVKGMVRNVIGAHKKRMNAEYLRHYRQFVATQARKQAKDVEKKQGT